MSARVQLPHPRGAVKGRGRLASLLSDRAALGLGVVGAGVASVGFLVWGAVPALLAGGALPLAWTAWRSTRSVGVKVEGGRVIMPDGTSLPRGEGSVRVVGHIEVSKKGYEYVDWDVDHSLGGNLFVGCSDPLAMRAFAEALASLGDWPLLWQPPGSYEVERREPDALDASFAVRGITEARLPAPTRPAPDDRYGTERELSGASRVQWTRSFLEQVGGATPVLFPFLVVSLLVGFRLGHWLPTYAVLAATAFAPARHPELRVSPRGIELVYRMLGGLPLWRRGLPAEAIESVYLETQPPKLVAAGDGIYAALARGISVSEGERLRGVVGRALLGDDGNQPTASLPAAEVLAAEVTAAAVPAAEGSCPACGHTGLARVGGDLDEERCPACGGRFLSQLGTERLVEGELGITRDMLRDLAGYFGGERRHCPSCRTRLSAVRLKGVTADLCQGCGGLWLDAGELAQLSSGRYEG